MNFYHLIPISMAKFLMISVIMFFLVGCTHLPTPPVVTPPATSPVPPVAFVGTGAELVEVATPTPGAVISSPLAITGRAPGYWFFEATAPVLLTNRDGLIIAEGYIQAIGERMTVDLVPFTGSLTFSDPSGEVYPAGTLILKKQNASGLPENDAAVEIPVLLY